MGEEGRKEEKPKSFREMMEEAKEKGRAIGKKRSEKMNAWSERRRKQAKRDSENRKRIWQTVGPAMRTRNKSDSKAFIDAYRQAMDPHPRLWRFIPFLSLAFYGVITYFVTTLILIPFWVSVYDFTEREAVQLGIWVEGTLISAGIIWFAAYLFGKSRRKDTITVEELRELLKEDREGTIKALLGDSVMISKNTPKESPEQPQESTPASASSSPSQEPSPIQE